MFKKSLLIFLSLYIALSAAGFAFAYSGESSGYDPVTFDTAIQFSAFQNLDGTVSMSWSKYAHAESFTYYKVIRSQENKNPVYPNDGYIFFDGNIDTLTYMDSEVPDGTNYYRICQIASPKRYCSSKVVTIIKTGSNETAPAPVITPTAADETPEPTLYTEPAAPLVEMVTGFSDLPVTHWASSCIENLSGKEIVASGEGVSFRPEDPINRAEFLKLMMKTYYPYSAETAGQNCYTDVRASLWYAPYVCAAKNQNVVSGYANNYFRPTSPITRAEGASILVKGLKISILTGTKFPFEDVVESWQASAVGTAYSKKLISGYNQTTFGPNDLLTRAQAAKLICNALDFQTDAVATEPASENIPVDQELLDAVLNRDQTQSTTPASTPVSTTRTSAIIVNHINTDLSKIPVSFINTAKAKFKIAYGHTSHGSQLTTGMSLLPEKAGAVYSYNADGTNGALYFNEYILSGDLGGDWDSQTRALLNRADNNINLVMWSWCGQLSTMTTAEVTSYLAKMNLLEKDFPNVIFVYITGHLDGTGEAGTLHRNNEQIRAYAKANNKVLFDFADIESYNPDGLDFLYQGATDGNDYADSSKNWATEWCAKNSTSPLCSANSCAHSTLLNCNLKGRAVWWLFARLADWSGI
jgi:hypothetical protein